MALEGIKPLGEEYSNIFEAGITEGWIDVFENKGKCGGGYSRGCYESVEAGNPLSSDDLCKTYHDLNIKYFGPDIIVDNEIDIGWASIPHFYCDFYVYQYVTGYAAASSISEMIAKEGESTVKRYTAFLKSGCSDYPIELLKSAGVDMTTSKPLEDAIKKFDELLDMVEKETLN